MLKTERADLLNFLQVREYTSDELKTIATNFLNLLESQGYTFNYQANIISSFRKEIKETLGADAPILKYLKISEEILLKRDERKDERNQAKLKNKILISYPDSIEIIHSLVKSPALTLNVLGFIFATGRRYSECESSNFKVVGESSLLFTGQLKTREREVYTIPTLYPAEELLNRLLVAEGVLDLSLHGADYQSLWKASNRIFGETIHKLRAKYCALVLKQEGILESDSAIDPMIRAKEILGHAWQSDATVAYQSYRVTSETIPESRKIMSAIAGINAQEKVLLEKEDPAQYKDLSGQEILEKILQDQPFLLEINKREASTIIRKEFEKRRGSKVNGKTLNNFLFDVGIIKNLEDILSPSEKILLEKLSGSQFSNCDKGAIIKLYRTFKPPKTRGICTLPMAQELLGDELTSEAFSELKAFFKGN